MVSAIKKVILTEKIAIYQITSKLDVPTTIPKLVPSSDTQSSFDTQFIF